MKPSGETTATAVKKEIKERVDGILAGSA